MSLIKEQMFNFFIIFLAYIDLKVIRENIHI